MGDGTLAPKTTFDTQLSNGTYPSARVINGALEILAGDRSGHLAILRLVAGGVTISILSAGPGFDLSSTFADVNGDGIADIVDTNDNNDPHEPVFITLANADGTFRERKQLAHPRNVAFPIDVKVSDLDGDGHADLVVSDFLSSNLYFFRGNGAGDFEEAIAINAGASVNAFEIADVNGDGHPDIVTANGDHTISVLLNRGPCFPTRHRAARH